MALGLALASAGGCTAVRGKRGYFKLPPVTEIQGVRFSTVILPFESPPYSLWMRAIGQELRHKTLRVHSAILTDEENSRWDLLGGEEIELAFSRVGAPGAVRIDTKFPVAFSPPYSRGGRLELTLNVTVDLPEGATRFDIRTRFEARHYWNWRMLVPGMAVPGGASDTL